MNKPITWYELHKRIGNQTIHTTRSKYVEVLIDGELWQCQLVYTHSGSDFRLEPVKKIEVEKCNCLSFDASGREVCFGTKERELCSCEGNKNKCDFYSK